MFRALLATSLLFGAAAPAVAQDSFKASDFYGVWDCNHGVPYEPNHDISSQFALVLLPGGTIDGMRAYVDSSKAQITGRLTGTWGEAGETLLVKGKWSGEKADTPITIAFQSYTPDELRAYENDKKTITLCLRNNKMPG